MRPLLLMLSVVPCLAMAAPAHAEYEPAACRGFFLDNPKGAQIDVTLAALDKCQRDFMGVVPIEQRAAAGESAVRAFIGRGERRMPLFIEYVHSTEGRTWLDVRTIMESKPRYAVLVAEASFSAVQTRWLQQDRLSAAAKAQSNKREHGTETVCIPSWGATIESTQKGRMTTVQLDSCKSWEFQFVEFLLAQAAKDAGECAAGQSSRSNDDRLEECLFRDRTHRGLR